MNEFSAVSPPRTSRRFNLISAALGFALFGGWAWYVGSRTTADAERVSPLVSALTQGTGSFVNVLIMVRCIAWLFHRLPPNFARLTLPTAITVAATGGCLAAAHALAGTSHIVQTIAPGLLVAFIFSVFTTFKLYRQTQR